MKTEIAKEEIGRSHRRARIIIIIFVFLFVILPSLIMAYDKYEDGVRAAEEEQRYNDGIALAKQGKFKEAADKLIYFGKDNPKYNNGYYVYQYVSAMQINDIKMQESYLEKIPKDYDGPLFAQILVAKQKIINSALHTLDTKHIYVGDPESKIQRVFGTPEHINRTVNGNHVLKQYVYGIGHYVYTEDGIVSSFQD